MTEVSAGSARGSRGGRQRDVRPVECFESAADPGSASVAQLLTAMREHRRSCQVEPVIQVLARRPPIPFDRGRCFVIPPGAETRVNTTSLSTSPPSRARLGPARLVFDTVPDEVRRPRRPNVLLTSPTG